MTAKKLLGYFFMVLSVLFALAIILQLQKLFKALADLVRVVTGTLGEYESAKAITVFLFWVIHFFVVIILCSYGRKWTRATFCALVLFGILEIKVVGKTNAILKLLLLNLLKCPNSSSALLAVVFSFYYFDCLF